jgi:UDP-GlcNAc:undecaprenyl-phosphate GlcNAc-1-phosphate transferase
MKRFVPIVLAVPVIAGLGVVGGLLGHWLSVPDPVHKVDAIVVTSGDAEKRVPAALALVRRGVSRTLVVALWSRGPVLDEQARIRDYVGRHASSPTTVEFVGPSRSVLAEAKAVRRYAGRARPGWQTLAVVDVPWQAARVRLAFERSLPGVDVSVWSDGSRYRASRWWRTARGTTLIEGAKTAATLAILGPLPASPGQRAPATLPLRALAGGLVVAALAGAGCRRLARRLGLVAVPRLWRTHATPTPMLGGLAILLGIAAGVLTAGGIRLGALGAVAAAGVVVLALVGFVDDVAGLGAGSRVAWAAVAGAVAWLLGLRVDLFRNATGAELGDGVLTVLWFVAITHALNLLDHIDGATAGVGAVSAATIAAVAAAGGQFVVAGAAAAVAGACLGYLVHNFPPARLFMGDMGALALGFALAALALGLKPHQRIPLSAFVPVFALAVPIFDTTVVTVSRLRAGRKPHVGGTDHVSHRLLVRGLSVREAVGVLVAAQVALGAAAFAVAVAPHVVGWAVVAVAAVAGIAALVFFLGQPEWTPPAHEELSRDVRIAMARALDAIAMFEQAATATGLAGADPGMMRALRDGTRRLDAIRSRFRPEAAPEGAEPTRS